MNIWKIACATLVIFVAGIVTGAVLVRLGERGPRTWNRPTREVAQLPINRPALTNAPAPLNPNRPGGPGGGGTGGGSNPLNRDFVPLLDRQLRLTSEQREQIERIMKASQERIRDLRQSVEPEVRQQIQQTQEQIRAVLTPEQKELYQRLMKRQQQQRRSETPAPTERRLREAPEQRSDWELREPRSPRRQMPPPNEPGTEELPPAAPQ